MTYSGFLLLFLAAPVVVLAILLRARIRPRHRTACVVVCLLALLYTSPWDNHAAKVRLWTFDPQFAPPSHFLFYLPWEEYAFYGLQGVLTCLLVVGLARLLRASDGNGEL